MKQLGVLLACCVGGSLLSLLLRGLLPGNVLGLTLLLALLIFGAVRLHHVESVADFLLQNMACWKSGTTSKVKHLPFLPSAC